MDDSFLSQIQTQMYVLIAIGLACVAAFLYWRWQNMDSTLSFGGSSNTQRSAFRDRRRARRSLSHGMIQIKDPFDLSILGTASVQDISSSGIRMRSAAALKKGQAIKGWMHSPHQEGLLEFSAKVAWLRPGSPEYLYGIEFKK